MSEQAMSEHMSEQASSIPWFALHIRMYDHENVEAALQHKGFEVFAPSYAAKRTVSGRERNVRAPLFPGYLFCSLDPYNRLPVLTVPGVIGILGTGNSLTPVSADEIEAVRRLVTSGLPCEPFRLVQPGEFVEVRGGALAGLKGVVVHHKGKYRLVIRVTALNDRAVSVEVDRDQVVRWEPATFATTPRIAANPVPSYK